MSRQLKNSISAFILLLVFSLNTLAGFACSIGMNMGYNKSHHRHDTEQINKSAGHHHGHHEKAVEYHKDESRGRDDTKDCCGDIARLHLSDKSVVSGISLPAPIFLVAFVSQFVMHGIHALSLFDNTTAYSLWRSWSFPDHTDLRIVIQSFQI